MMKYDDSKMNEYELILPLILYFIDPPVSTRADESSRYFHSSPMILWILCLGGMLTMGERAHSYFYRKLSLSEETHPGLSITIFIMKVMHLQKTNRMFETNLGSTSTYKKIQNYVFDMNNVLGVGNFSKVYRGINQLTNQVCAVKVVEMERMKTPSLIKLLQAQCEILQSLKHPNILNCIQIFTSKNNCYIITDLCNDGDLESMIRKRGPLDEPQARKIVYETFSGLKYLNEMRVIHRDFKVANVFMSDGVAKIADFGFARKLKHPDEVFNDINIGSPIYMSPESLLNNRYGPKTDVWAFGVFLYEILHGDTPLYFCKSQMDLKAHIGIPIKQSVLSPYLPPQLKNLILRCLEVDERKRISMHQMANHPYIIHLKSQFQPRTHSLTLKVSESTTANSRLQVNDKTQNRSKITSYVNVHPESQTPINSIPARPQKNYQPPSPQRNTIIQKSKQPAGNLSPKHILRHKNEQHSASFCQQRVSVRSQSLDQSPLTTNTLRTKLLTTVNRENGQQTPNSSNRQIQPTQLISGSPPPEIQPTQVINGSITFGQCVHILHYCRLIYKCITLALRENCHLQSNVHLANWLLSLLKEISNKPDRVRFDGDRASVREKKLKDVVHQYQSKYEKQLLQYVSYSPILNVKEITEKIKSQILTLAKIIQAQVSKSDEMAKLLIYLDLLREATTLLNECIEKQDFSMFGVMKIQDLLSKKPDTANLDIQGIKNGALT